MRKLKSFLQSSFVFAMIFLLNACQQDSQQKLNVVFILADVLGVNDLSLYGSEFHETPNIDALSEIGMMFTQAYSANPLCSPTRASILTGLYPSRIGITMPHCHREEAILEKYLHESAPANSKTIRNQTVTRLDTSYYTLAEAFRDNGYATAHFGKWHLGPEPYSPLEHGFDLDIPHTPAPSPLVDGFFYPFPVWEGHGKPGDNLEDLLADEAVRYIHEHKDEPFYMSYWAFQVHSPWQAKEEQIDKYRAKAHPDSHQRHPVYAGMLETLDEVVGRLVDALDKAGILERTVIIFVGDNGPYIKAVNQHIIMPEEFEEVPVSSAYPLRDGKGQIYEGGTRVPLIVIWPGRVEPGSVSNELHQSTDFYPTFVDMFGLEVPEDLKFDGVSMKAMLENNEAVRDEIFCHFPDKLSTSLRQGDWKLIRFYCDNPDQSDRHELYNLAEDEGEANDLAATETDIFEKLKLRMDELLEETEGLIPIPNPDYDPKAK